MEHRLLSDPETRDKIDRGEHSSIGAGDRFNGPVVVIPASSVIELQIREPTPRRPPERGSVRAGERGDEFWQCTEMQMQQTANRMMVKEPIVFRRQIAEARRTLKRLNARHELPPRALVATNHRVFGTEPAILQ